MQVDVDMNEESADAYGVQTLPTIIFAKKGRLSSQKEM